MKLRDFKIGDSVKLKGAQASAKPLLIGDISREGRYELWLNRESRDAGQPWAHSAAGSHEADQ
ncbi:hypothetical protein [Propionivibrio sp.]|uniref:hypothetical protein n=1 Tax=Propionivibrio sp. TaxID=2212460 RepID=UPI003BEFEB52